MDRQTEIPHQSMILSLSGKSQVFQRVSILMVGIQTAEDVQTSLLKLILIYWDKTNWKLLEEHQERICHKMFLTLLHIHWSSNLLNQAAHNQAFSANPSPPEKIRSEWWVTMNHSTIIVQTHDSRKPATRMKIRGTSSTSEGQAMISQTQMVHLEVAINSSS